jgi:hypothetical protein
MTRDSFPVRRALCWVVLLFAAAAIGAEDADAKRLADLIPMRKSSAGKSAHSSLNSLTRALAVRGGLSLSSLFGRQEEYCELPVTCAEGCCPAGNICVSLAVA